MQAGEPSHTARGAAAYRAIHQTLESGVIFSDPLAARILQQADLAIPASLTFAPASILPQKIL